MACYTGLIKDFELVFKYLSCIVPIRYQLQTNMSLSVFIIILLLAVGDEVSVAVRIHAVMFLVMTVCCLVGWYQRLDYTLEVEAKHCSETSVCTYQTTECHHVCVRPQY